MALFKSPAFARMTPMSAGLSAFGDFSHDWLQFFMLTRIFSKSGVCERKQDRHRANFGAPSALFCRGKRAIFDLTLATEAPSCAPAVLVTGSQPYARKPRLCDLDGVLPRRAHRSFCLRHSPVFHHLPLPQEPQTRVGSGRPVSAAAKSNSSASDF